MKEKLIDTKTAQKRLGVGATYMTRIKTEMGIKGSKKFFLSDVEHYIRSRSQPQLDRQPEAAGSSGEQLSRRALKAA